MIFEKVLKKRKSLRYSGYVHQKHFDFCRTFSKMNFLILYKNQLLHTAILKLCFLHKIQNMISEKVLLKKPYFSRSDVFFKFKKQAFIFVELFQKIFVLHKTWARDCLRAPLTSVWRGKKVIYFWKSLTIFSLFCGFRVENQWKKVTFIFVELFQK